MPGTNVAVLLVPPTATLAVAVAVALLVAVAVITTAPAVPGAV
jgi:hypothetical protein